ncbi:MAG: glutamate--tRNA ligase [Gaiella sp.]
MGRVRVRFAPSPTGSLHLGNALVAVANRTFADRHGGDLLLRIDDTDRTREMDEGERLILEDLEWLGVRWERGPVRQSDRAGIYTSALRALLRGEQAREDDEGAIRLGRTTLVRPDGSVTYQLASVVDDLAFGITHVIRGSDHRPNEEVQSRIAKALGGHFPEVVYVGLLVGEDGKKLSKRHGAVSVADLRAEGIPAGAVRAYLEELGTPSHDVRLDRSRLGRLAVEAIGAMDDAELARMCEAPLSVVPALRGARTLVEARAFAAQILAPIAWVRQAGDGPTLERFLELRKGVGDALDEAGARAIVRELKAVGGDLKVLRRALTGAEHGPELWTVLVALPLEETLRRGASG